MNYSNLTPEAIRAFTDADARATLDELARTYFGKALWKSNLAEMVDMQPRTVSKWMEDGNRPPGWAIQLLAAKLEAQAYRMVIEGLKRIQEAISTLPPSPGTLTPRNPDS